MLTLAICSISCFIYFTMPKISAVIISYNEETYIGKCLSSLEGVADDIIVVDSYSTDRTKEICKQFNCRFILHPFEGYIEQKNWAMQQAKYEYILSLDADEMLSDKLRNSIKEVKNNWSRDGYYFNRLNNYYGKWLRHSGVYPDKKLRLADRRKAYWDGINPHDTMKLLPGAVKGYLKGDLLHYTQASEQEHREKIYNFSSISAGQYYDLRGKSSWPRIILSLVWRFAWNYFFRLGFLDGKIGWKVCYLNAYSSFLKHLKTRTINIDRSIKNKNDR